MDPLASCPPLCPSLRHCGLSLKSGSLLLCIETALDDLLTNVPTALCALPPLEVLKDTFTDPEPLRPDRAAARVTEVAAARVCMAALPGMASE